MGYFFLMFIGGYKDMNTECIEGMKKKMKEHIRDIKKKTELEEDLKKHEEDLKMMMDVMEEYRDEIDHIKHLEDIKEWNERKKCIEEWNDQVSTAEEIPY